MGIFYVALITIGVLFIITSLVFIFKDDKISSRKSIEPHEELIVERKTELLNAITDADNRVKELNQFAEYIVNKIDLKSQELFEVLENTETTKQKQIETPVLPENYTSLKAVSEYKCECPNEILGDYKQAIVEPSEIGTKFGLTPGSKNRLVHQYINEGLTESEIAKKLNIGIGEIRLIETMK